MEDRRSSSSSSSSLFFVIVVLMTLFFVEPTTTTTTTTTTTARHLLMSRRMSHRLRVAAAAPSSPPAAASAASAAAAIQRHFASIANAAHLDPNAVDSCPPPPSNMPAYLCRAPVCRSDNECRPLDLRRCCFNGCKFTCLIKMLPPPLVDWAESPSEKGGWILENREDSSVETCTTSHISSTASSSSWMQPLLCPHGYTCHILDLGDALNGVPNRGHCVKERHTQKQHAQGPVWHFRIRTGSTSNLGCTLDSQVYSNGAFFQYDRHPCTCEQGMITCAVARYRENTNESSAEANEPR